MGLQQPRGIRPFRTFKQKKAMAGNSAPPRSARRAEMIWAKKSPAASAFAAQPLGDSLKTRRPSPFCPFGAAPYLLTRQAFAHMKTKGFSGKLLQAKTRREKNGRKPRTFWPDKKFSLKKKPGSLRLRGTAARRLAKNATTVAFLRPRPPLPTYSAPSEGNTKSGRRDSPAELRARRKLSGQKKTRSLRLRGPAARRLAKNATPVAFLRPRPPLPTYFAPSEGKTKK